jgi:cell division septum initiation protein DivIVA
MDILKMIEDLRTHLDRPKQFGPIIWGLNRDECFMLLSKIRASLPEQVKSADKLTRESERILTSAQQDARAFLDRARAEAEKLREGTKRECERMTEEASIKQARMVEESEILRLSQAQSKALLERTQDELRELKRGADQYALDVLEELEEAVSRVMVTIQNGRERLDGKRKELAEA